jgi:signal transduction histidine kinase
MFFGGFSGATAFFPKDVTGSEYVPPVVLTDFRLFGTEVQPGLKSPLKKMINFTDTIVLSHRQNVFSIGFSTLSYLNPTTNRYRYMLEGLDRNWSEVGSDQRFATYTTLPAGKYVFRVEGATSRGPWNEPGAILRIEILPAWWSTWWFRTALAVLLLILMAAVYNYRLHQMRQQFNVRLDERVLERTRIARELHDTLLQSLHGLMFRFQAARNKLPGRPEEAMQALDGAIIRTEQAIAESRDAIKDLRSEPMIQKDLVELIAAEGQDLEASHRSEGDSPAFSMIVEGERRTLSPDLCQDVYRITRELLRNAFRHARAHRIETEVRYDEGLLRVRIRDDGTGIDPKVLEEGGRPARFGLPGVRERAERIGAQLDFWSEVGAGTEVQLTIPATAANEASNNRTGFKLFCKVRIYGHRP